MIVLSEKYLSGLDKNIKVISINRKTLKKFDLNTEVEVIVCSRATACTVEEMNLPNLKLIQLTSAGFENVPIEKFAQKNVMIANAGSLYSASMAETIVFGILSMAKKYRNNPNNRRIRIRRGYDKYIHELCGKKVMILGAGNIGTDVARRLSGFGMDIFAYDPYCREKNEFKGIYRTRKELIDTIFEFDYIVSAMPYTDETHFFINAELLSNMNKCAVLVNVSRQKTINENDLYYALKKGKIGGAVLDMFQILPNPLTNRFRRLNNTIIWPGVSAISYEIKEKLDMQFSENIMKYFNGEKPDNVISV